MDKKQATLVARRSIVTASLAPLAAMAKTSGKTLTIGVEDRWPPFAFDEGGNAGGWCVEIAAAALIAADIPHRFEVMPYRRCVHLTKNGALDACMAVPKKPSIQAELLVSRVPLIQVTGLVFALKGGPHDRVLDSLKELSGRRLGVARGYDYGDAIDNNPSILKTPTSNPDSVFDLILLDRTDFAIYEASRAKRLFRKRPDLRRRVSIVGAMPPQGVYMAFSRSLASAENHRQRFDQALADQPEPRSTADFFA